jgi:hypothetical protein
MQANTDRIQTTHVDYMRKRLEREAIDEASYQRYLVSAVADVVGRQAAAGLTVVNDGEYPKSSWYRYITERLDGLEYRAAPSERPKPTANAGGGYWVVTGPIKYRGHEQVQLDIANLKGALRKHPQVKGFLLPPAQFLDYYAWAEQKVVPLNPHRVQGDRRRRIDRAHHHVIFGREPGIVDLRSEPGSSSLAPYRPTPPT